MLFFKSKTKIAIRIIERNVPDYAAECFHIILNFAAICSAADEIAENPAEIYMTRITEETPTIGQHSNKRP